jgi:hypothetical protein
VAAPARAAMSDLFKTARRWRSLFADDVLDGHLDRLQCHQQPDGGWPLTWEPPGDAALLEWRGIVTLDALRTLVSYGRLSPRLSALSDTSPDRSRL